MIDPSLGKLSFSKHHNNMFRHEPSMDPKTIKYKFDEEEDIYRVSNYLPSRSLLITKFKIVTLQ